MPELIKKTVAQATTSGFVSALLLEPSDMVPPRAKTLNFSLFEVGSEDIDWKLLGSNDGTNWKELDADTLSGDAWDNSVVNPNYWLYLDLQVKDTVAETHGAVNVEAVGE